MSNTLVVGGKGYIGKHLQKRLPEFIYCGKDDFDLRNKEEITKYIKNLDIKMCIILSASINYEKEIDFKKEPFDTNLQGLNNLLSLLNKHVKVVYFSSMTVYDHNNISPVKEEAFLGSLHSYGLSKIYAEYLIKYYNFPSLIVRIPGIYGGDRENGLIYNTIKKIKNKIPIEIDTTSLGYWESMHIEDMLEAFCVLITKFKFDNKTEIINIAYGEEIDFISTIEFIKKQLHSSVEIKVNRKYQKLYLSNSKMKQYANLSLTYYERLNSYIAEHS